MATSASARPIEGAILQLKGLLGRRASDAQSVRAHHSHGESYHPAAAPDIVCLPHTTEEVQAIVAISIAYQVPIVPFGSGKLRSRVTSHALHGGVCIDLREAQPDSARRSGRPRCHRRGRRDPSPALEGPANYRADVLGRSWAPTPQSAEWPRRAPRARWLSATARCALETSSG